MKIIHYNNDLEADACLSFLVWQNQKVVWFMNAIEALAVSKGRGIPLIYDNKGDLIAVGFQDLVKYWEDNGLWLI